MTTVAYQGEPGAFSEQAAYDFFGSACTPVGRENFDHVFDDVTAARCDYGIVPVENSVGGAIHRNYDLLLRHKLHIIGETAVPIHWCLYALPGVQMSGIKRVISHWQALAQCEMTLTRLLPNAQREQVYDTAGSVKMLRDNTRDNAGSDPIWQETAALASKRAQALYGVPILAEGLGDDATNYTRFVALSRAPVHVPLNVTAKTSIVFCVRNVAGALHKAIAAFALRDIDICKIESRPLQGSPWEYLFYLDFVGNQDEPNSARALANLSEFTTLLRVLGTYPKFSSQSPTPNSQTGRQDEEMKG